MLAFFRLLGRLRFNRRRADKGPAKPLRRRRPHVEELEPRVLLANQSFVVPAEVPGTLEVRTVERLAAFRNEMGVFAVQDAAGRVGGLLPGQKGYARAALRNARPLFDGAQEPGTAADLPFAPGTRVGFYLIQNGTRARWRRRNADNRPGRGPLALFSFSAANPHHFDHCRTVVEGDRVSLYWEDVAGGDNDFNDLIATIPLAPRPSPALAAASPTARIATPPPAPPKHR